MEQPEFRVFLEKAGSELAAIRSGLLLAAQNGFSSRDIEMAASRVDNIEAYAASLGLKALTGFSARLRYIAEIGISDANPALDILAAIEATLLEFSLRSPEFLDDVDGLVEASFSHLDGGVTEIEQAQDVETST